MEAEQEAVFTSVGKELDGACRSLAGDSFDKLEVPYEFLWLGFYPLFISTLLSTAPPKKNPSLPKKKILTEIVHHPPATRQKKCVLFLRLLCGWLGATLRLKLCRATPAPRRISLLCLLLMRDCFLKWLKRRIFGLLQKVSLHTFVCQFAVEEIKMYAEQSRFRIQHLAQRYYILTSCTFVSVCTTWIRSTEEFEPHFLASRL